MATTKKTLRKSKAADKVEVVGRATTKVNKRETTASLKKRIAELEEQVKQSTDEYGKMVETMTNLRIQKDAMLGQVLKGLYLIGIDPDIIMHKCQQMFQKRVVAD